MEQCLIDNKICSEQNRKCKECKLDSCKEVIKMIEEEQKYIDRDNLRKLKNSLPERLQRLFFFRYCKFRQRASALFLYAKRMYFK